MNRTIHILSVGALSALAVGCAEITNEPPEENVEVTSIEISASTTALPVGDSVQLTATAFNSDGEDVTLTTEIVWASEDASIVFVNQSGLARALAEGQTRVTASDNGSEVTGEIEIDVVPAPSD